MDEATVLEIADTWSFWDRAVPDSIPRSVALPKSLPDRLALIVQGVRRCGKSTLLTQMLERFDLDPRHCAFVNFEDPRLAGALHYTTLEALVRAFDSRQPEADRRTYFLDEIQWVDGWAKWLRTQLERPGGNSYVISGSNAHLLSGELSGLLTGRHLTFELYPFDLAEFRLKHSAGTLPDYLVRGGFPEPLNMAEGDGLLRQYLADIVERDVRERVGARSSLPLRQLVQMVFEEAGSELSLRRIAAACGIAVDTAATYLEACENAYLLFACPFFAWSERKRGQRNKKYYPIDTGLRRVAVTATGRDRGKALECATFIELRKRFRDVFYWRGKGEVDFVVHTDSGPKPIQVTWDEPLERHERALDEFFDDFPSAAEPHYVTAATFESEFERMQ